MLKFWITFTIFVLTLKAGLWAQGAFPWRELSLLWQKVEVVTRITIEQSLVTAVTAILNCIREPKDLCICWWAQSWSYLKAKEQKVQKAAEVPRGIYSSISFDYQNRNRARVEYRHRGYIFRRRQYQMLFQLLEKGCRSSGQMLTLTKPGEKITTEILTWINYHWSGYSVLLTWCLHSMFKYLPKKVLGKWDRHIWYHFWDNTAICTPLGVIHNREILWMDRVGQNLTLLSFGVKRRILQWL